MKLKYNKIYSGSSITVILSLVKYTKEELAAIKNLGAPQIVIDKTYGDTVISIDTTVSDFTNIEYVFNSSTEKINETIEEVDDYIDTVKQEVAEKMTDLMLLYKQLEKLLNDKTGEINIEDGITTSNEQPGQVATEELF